MLSRELSLGSDGSRRDETRLSGVISYPSTVGRESGRMVNSFTSSRPTT